MRVVDRNTDRVLLMQLSTFLLQRPGSPEQEREGSFAPILTGKKISRKCTFCPGPWFVLTFEYVFDLLSRSCLLILGSDIFLFVLFCPSFVCVTGERGLLPCKRS